MTKLEKEALQTLAKRLHTLASLEQCGLNDSIKKTIRPYMMWFGGVAFDLEKIVELADDKQDFIKREELEEIIRTNL